ncbi:MAG: hypothetical protein HFE58_09720 [Firmicutes bacterium]|jgi:hypothetical protein|nr:hypothetical protein [Bacillota bacterium]
MEQKVSKQVFFILKGKLFSLVKSFPIASLLPFKNTLGAEKPWALPKPTSFLKKA